MKICVDASVVVRLLNGSLSPAMSARWSEWQANAVTLMAPSLLRYEVTNALYRYTRAGVLDQRELSETLSAFLAIPIVLVASDQIHQAAIELAAKFDLPATYDAHYLAAAQMYGADLWTGDRRLYSRLEPHVTWIHLSD